MVETPGEVLARRVRTSEMALLGSVSPREHTTSETATAMPLFGPYSVLSHEGRAGLGACLMDALRTRPAAEWPPLLGLTWTCGSKACYHDVAKVIFSCWFDGPWLSQTLTVAPGFLPARFVSADGYLLTMPAKVRAPLVEARQNLASIPCFGTTTFPTLAVSPLAHDFHGTCGGPNLLYVVDWGTLTALDCWLQVAAESMNRSSSSSSSSTLGIPSSCDSTSFLFRSQDRGTKSGDHESHRGMRSPECERLMLLAFLSRCQRGLLQDVLRRCGRMTWLADDLRAMIYPVMKLDSPHLARGAANVSRVFTAELCALFDFWCRAKDFVYVYSHRVGQSPTTPSVVTSPCPTAPIFACPTDFWQVRLRHPAALLDGVWPLLNLTRPRASCQLSGWATVIISPVFALSTSALPSTSSPSTSSSSGRFSSSDHDMIECDRRYRSPRTIWPAVPRCLFQCMSSSSVIVMDQSSWYREKLSALAMPSVAPSLTYLCGAGTACPPPLEVVGFDVTFGCELLEAGVHDVTPSRIVSQSVAPVSPSRVMVLRKRFLGGVGDEVIDAVSTFLHLSCLRTV